MFIVAILLITYIFPKQSSFSYSFDEGRPWQYGLLTAPFDFPIYKHRSAKSRRGQHPGVL